MDPSTIRRWGLAVLLVAAVGGVAATMLSSREPEVSGNGRNEIGRAHV